MTKTIHIIKGVAYKFSRSDRKWRFKASAYGKRFEYITPVKGGADVAHKIAALIRKGMIRTRGKGLDDVAHTELELINHA